MTPANKQLGIIIVSAIVAIGILVSAWFLNGSDYENAWLYLTSIWIVIICFYEAYEARKKNKDKK